MEKIQSVRFCGYKSFNSDECHEVNLSPYVSVFIGKNNSGKSSCIDSLEASLKPNHYLSVKNDFKKLAISFLLSNEKIEYAFSKNISGGLAISGNHYEYGKKFIGKRIYVDLGEKLSGRERIIEVSVAENQPDLELPNGKNQWETLCRRYNDFKQIYRFRRINADRDIVPEVESKEESLDSNGDGATNLLRKFVNNSKYDEKIVEEHLLNELNKIMAPDTVFKNIRVQEIESDDKLLWEIFLEETNGKRFALSKSGSGLKTIILMLINLHIIPKLKDYQDREIIFAFEELENNLHPALQRKVFEYLYEYAKTNNAHVFLTTHSHIAINTFYDKENTAIYHVTKNKGVSSICMVKDYLDCTGILEDLDVKASDLFQSNGIIWVEGPSDRIYINRWLKVFCNSEFLEGSDYQFLYYGGKLLSHLSTLPPAEAEQYINILTTNRNAAIIIDSDKRSSRSKINSTKTRIQKEFCEIGGFCWITKGKEIENYLSAPCIEIKYGATGLKNIGQYELFPDYIKRWDKNFAGHKVSFAKSISEYITIENSKDMLDLEKQIKQLYETIQKWNLK